MRKLALSLALASVMVIAAGCGRSTAIEEFSGTIPAGVTQKTVTACIFDAGDNRDWIMKQLDDHTIQALYMARGHSITVNVVYSDTGYRIEYVDSKNMDYDNGKIHSNYNRWTNNLRHDIDVRLAQAQARGY